MPNLDSTIVPPGAALSSIIEKSRPMITKAEPRIGESRIVCLNDRVIWILASAGRTRSAEISSTPTIGMDTTTANPARMEFERVYINANRYKQ